MKRTGRVCVPMVCGIDYGYGCAKYCNSRTVKKSIRAVPSTKSFRDSSNACCCVDAEVMVRCLDVNGAPTSSPLAKHAFNGPVWIIALGLEGSGHHGVCAVIYKATGGSGPCSLSRNSSATLQELAMEELGVRLTYSLTIRAVPIPLVAAGSPAGSHGAQHRAAGAPAQGRAREDLGGAAGQLAPDVQPHDDAEGGVDDRPSDASKLITCPAPPWAPRSPGTEGRGCSYRLA